MHEWGRGYNRKHAALLMGEWAYHTTTAGWGGWGVSVEEPHIFSYIQIENGECVIENG